MAERIKKKRGGKDKRIVTVLVLAVEQNKQSRCPTSVLGTVLFFKDK